MVENHAHLTPEKQLLKLIEEPHAGFRASGNKGPQLGVFSIGTIKGRLGFLRQQAASFLNSWSGPIDVKKVNLLLTVLATVTGVYFTASSVFLSMRLAAPANFIAKTDAQAGKGVPKPPSTLKAITLYQQKVQARDIFHIGGQAAQQQPQQENAAKQKIEEIVGKYKLVGISWSDNPDAMIENSSEQKTYFLKRGQTLNGMRIEGIFRDKVVVSYAGQETELR